MRALTADVGKTSAAAREQEHDEDEHGAAEDRRRRGELRATDAVGGDVADDVVTRCEEHGAAERVEQPDRAEVLRAVALGDQRQAARDDRALRRRAGGSVGGSPSAVIAIVTATSGAAPATTDARAGPASRTPSTNRSCAPPGASSPGQHERPELAAPSRGRSRATTAQTQNPLSAVANAPTRASRLRRIEKPSATDMPPKSRAEASASATPDTRPNPNRLALTAWRSSGCASIGGGRDRQPVRRAPRARSRGQRAHHGATSTRARSTEDGLRISGKSGLHRACQRDRRPGELPDFDLGIVATKATQLEDAAARARGPRSRRDADDDPERPRRRGAASAPTATGRCSRR